MVGCAAVLRSESSIHDCCDFRRWRFRTELALPLCHNDAGETVPQYVYRSAAHVEELIDAEQEK